MSPLFSVLLAMLVLKRQQKRSFSSRISFLQTVHDICQLQGNESNETIELYAETRVLYVHPQKIYRMTHGNTTLLK